MIIFYKKTGQKAGEIHFTFPESFAIPKVEVAIKENGKEVFSTKDYDYTYLMPLDAHSFEDPRHKDYIHNCKVIVKRGRVFVKNGKQEIPTVDKKDLKDNLKAWKDTWDYLKTQHPDKKIKDAMREEKMII